MTDLWYHLSYLVQILILSVFWVYRLERKPNFGWRVAACILALCGSVGLLSYLHPLLGASNWLVFSFPYFMILVLFCMALGLCFDATPDVILLTLLLPSTAQLCASAVGNVVSYLMDWTPVQIWVAAPAKPAVLQGIAGFALFGHEDGSLQNPYRNPYRQAAGRDKKSILVGLLQCVPENLAGSLHAFLVCVGVHPKGHGLVAVA